MQSYLNLTTKHPNKKIEQVETINNHTIQNLRNIQLDNNRNFTVNACEQSVFPVVLTFQGITPSNGINIDLPAYILPEMIYSILVYSDGNLNYIRDDRGGKNSLNVEITGQNGGEQRVRLKFGNGGGGDHPFICNVVYSPNHNNPVQPVP